MINYIKIILTFFQNGYDKTVTVFENQLKSTTKTAVLFLCIGILLTFIFTYYPVYSKIDHDNLCATQVKELEREILSLHKEVNEAYHKGFKDGENKGEQAITRVNEIINNLLKSKQ